MNTNTKRKTVEEPGEEELIEIERHIDLEIATWDSLVCNVCGEVFSITRLHCPQCGHGIE